VVVKVGRRVTRFAVGDKVCSVFEPPTREISRMVGSEVDGVPATHFIFGKEKIVRIPGHLSWTEAACIPCAGLTAWNALTYDENLTTGKTVLFSGS
jgi:NADPH:quinone reductase-like Zn-dependent oxidoreductase